MTNEPHTDLTVNAHIDKLGFMCNSCRRDLVLDVKQFEPYDDAGVCKLVAFPVCSCGLSLRVEYDL